MDIEKFLLDHDIKPTTFRSVLIDILKNANKPVSYDEIVSLTNANKTTVYRNLDLLEKQGILITSLANNKNFYELADHAKAYFVCEKCHKMQEISMPNLDFKNVKSVVVKGTCDECSKLRVAK